MCNVSNMIWCVTSEPFQDDAGLLLGSKLAAGDAFDISYELLRFLGPGFSLPGMFRYSLSQWTAPFSDTLLLPDSRSEPLGIHYVKHYSFSRQLRQEVIHKNP